MANCKQCGVKLSDSEIEKMKAGEKPYDFADTPKSWGIEADDNVDWFCGDCARSNDPDVPDDWEVYYLG